MDDRLEKLEELNQMLKSELITKSEYKTLLKGILDRKVETNFNTDSKISEKYSIERIKDAGSNALNLFYCIIFQILLALGYWFMIGIKIGHDNATGQSENFESFYKYVNDLSYFVYIIEFGIALSFIVNLFYLGVNLKNVDKQPR
jgi:hypothetical protein